ncbi:MAG: hypothetical protein JXR27_04955 [Paludibacteraceae bacterium]|nr:hypothetical protein [Paludibacteraceae bacterium]
MSSCSDDLVSYDPEYKLAFSTDTLSFDTVFSTFGSTTQKILLYNPNKKALKINNIQLSGGRDSHFRLNVDGLRNEDNRFRDIEVRANDSLYVFVEVTIDPHDSDAPVLISDSILFTTNGNAQKVRLEAYGQDVILWNEKLILNDTVLSAARPYLIYGYLAVDSAKTLTLPAGCRLYFHNNANLIIYGNLIANGLPDNPVVMQGDRLDEVKYSKPVAYNRIAGQWGGVYLLWNQGQHRLNHVRITSGYVGIYSPNNDRNQLPEIEISNSYLHNFLLYAVVAQNTNLKIHNSEVSNSGSYTLYLNGGTHEILQSTVVNFYNSGGESPTSRDKFPAVMIMGLNRPATMRTRFRNSVISGSLANELSIASRFPANVDADFSNNFVRRKTAYEFPAFQHTRWYEEGDTILFKSTTYNAKKNQYFDFMPDSLSALRGLALPDVASQFPLDLNGNNRMADGAPDAGAYEWISVVR